MKKAPETETIDRLFLELSQFTQAKTWTQLQLEAKAQVQATRILELEAALMTYATADYLTTQQQQAIACRCLEVGCKDFEKAMKQCQVCGGAAGEWHWLSKEWNTCETCGGSGKV